MRHYEDYEQSEVTAASWNYIGTVAPLAFADYDGPYELARRVYKDTSCGAGVWFTVARTDGEGEIVHENVYSERDMPRTWEEWNTAGVAIVGIYVSSIVEGVEQTTGTYGVDIDDESIPETVAAEFWQAVDTVETESSEIWNETHGCETCAKHWSETGDDDEFADVHFDQGGNVPVWEDCPECGGSGTVI